MKKKDIIKKLKLEIKEKNESILGLEKQLELEQLFPDEPEKDLEIRKLEAKYRDACGEIDNMRNQCIEMANTIRRKRDLIEKLQEGVKVKTKEFAEAEKYNDSVIDFLKKELVKLIRK